MHDHPQVLPRWAVDDFWFFTSTGVWHPVTRRQSLRSVVFRRCLGEPVTPSAAPEIDAAPPSDPPADPSCGSITEDIAAEPSSGHLVEYGNQRLQCSGSDGWVIVGGCADADG